MSPAREAKDSRLRTLRHFENTDSVIICLVASFDVQILLVRHLRLSLPWRHLDPEVKENRVIGLSSCCSLRKNLNVANMFF